MFVVKKNWVKITFHSVFWLVSISIILFLFYYNENKSPFNLTTISKSLIINAGFALAVYINLLILIPHFLTQKNYIFYIFWLVLLLTISSITIQILLLSAFNPHFISEVNTLTFNTDLHAAYFFASFIYVAVTSFLKFIKEWLTLQELNLKLAKMNQQKLEAELKTLKSQLNPHFLFNSLNNIYSLAILKSEKVPELIITLSDLMRHIIYESRENFIPLVKEIEFVNNFIALQSIRISNQEQLLYQIKGEIPKGKIAPLLFEPFIDNAFKHGLTGEDSNVFIQILFDFTDSGWIRFSVKNNYLKKETSPTKNSGIGLSNVKDRLLYLYNSSEFELAINDCNQIHSVSLRLKIM